MRTDDAATFQSKAMKAIQDEKGIIHQPGTRYTPQTDGKSERAIRTIKDKARCLMIEAKVPSSFWSFATKQAVYLSNRLLPCRVNPGNKIPYEV